jgi:DNA processing protein
VAIVGSRVAHPDALAYARSLAADVAAAGGVVVSGGAIGIDAAAHEGALAKGGRTWCVAATGHAHTYPEEHARLYARIATSGGGAMIWPFPPDRRALRHNFRLRNGVLVALANAVVIVQARIPSGALNAAKWCRDLAKPLFVVLGPPWMPGFDGCWRELDRGAKPLQASANVLTAAGLRAGKERVFAAPRPLTPSEEAVLSALTGAPLHLDEVAARSHLAAQVAATALLTLALENVVVEGPAGFYCRANPT